VMIVNSLGVFPGECVFPFLFLLAGYCQSALGGVLPLGVGCIIRLDTSCLDKKESGECHIMLLSRFDAMTSAKLMLTSTVPRVFNI
jgi:hypothetical protein